MNQKFEVICLVSETFLLKNAGMPEQCTNGEIVQDWNPAWLFCC
jgi:hypothetical protein